MFEASIFLKNCDFIGIQSNNQGFLSISNQEEGENILEITFVYCSFRGILSDFSLRLEPASKSFFDILGDRLIIMVSSCSFSDNVFGILNFFF